MLATWFYLDTWKKGPMIFGNAPSRSIIPSLEVDLDENLTSQAVAM